jgi:hypothetical protein
MPTRAVVQNMACSFWHDQNELARKLLDDLITIAKVATFADPSL